MKEDLRLSWNTEKFTVTLQSQVLVKGKLLGICMNLGITSLQLISYENTSLGKQGIDERPPRRPYYSRHNQSLLIGFRTLKSWNARGGLKASYRVVLCTISLH